MQKAGLIGDPVSHSLSRVMHNAAFAHLGIDADYELWETPLADLPARVTALRNPSMLGANVTVPHKQAVMPLLDSFTDTAQRIGAVNTIIPEGKLLRGDNTDAYGFATSLWEVISSPSVRKAVIVGAGGASRAVLVALQEAGVPSITLVNRTRSRAEDLATELSRPGSPTIATEDLANLELAAVGAQAIVNATAVGWHGDELPFGEPVLAALANDAVVVDLTYRQTAVLSLAAGLGLTTLDGLPMLIHQGARSFELWTGASAPVAVMSQAVHDEQARRANEPG